MNKATQVLIATAAATARRAAPGDDTRNMPQPFDGFSWLATPDSSMFVRVGYNAVTETLRAVFRNSGRMYEYRNFSGMHWFNFYRAKSLGAFFRKYIVTRDKGVEVVH